MNVLCGSHLLAPQSVILQDANLIELDAGCFADMVLMVRTATAPLDEGLSDPG